MDDVSTELDQLQIDYKAAVEAWITAIRTEEGLASVHHTVAQVDEWENAHFIAEELRHRTDAAKNAYEAALRRHFFEFD